MKITYYVNTMVLLEGQNTRLLCDPWITFDYPSGNGWYNFPQSHMSRDDVAAIRPDYIYITHTHYDHFDPETLSLFERSTPILIAHYEANFTEREIRNVGFTDIRVSEPGKRLPLNGSDSCWIEPSEVYKDVDSVGLICIDGEKVINFNDNPFHEGQVTRLQAIAGEIDVAMIPFGAHGPYPMFFRNLSDEDKQQASDRRRQHSYQNFSDYIKALKPKQVLPFGSGLVAGSDKALCYSYSGIGTRTDAVKNAKQSGLKFREILLSEKCSYDTQTREQNGVYVEKTHTSEKDYLLQIAHLPTQFDQGGKFHIDDSERIDLTALFAAAVARQIKWKKRLHYNTGSSYFFDLGEPGLYRVCLKDGTVNRVTRSAINDDVYEIFFLPYSLAVGLLTRHYIWSNIKTQYVDYFRQGEMDIEMLMLMNYLHV